MHNRQYLGKRRTNDHFHYYTMTGKELHQRYLATSPAQAASFINAIWNAPIPSLELISALGNILDSEAQERRAAARKGRGMSGDERASLEFSAKLTACLLILLCDTRSYREASTRALLFLEYASYLSRSNYDIVKLAVDCGSYPMTAPGFTRSMVEKAIGTDLLVFKMLEGATFDRGAPFAASDCHSLRLGGGKLTVRSSVSAETKAFDAHQGRLEVLSRNLKNEKLKEGRADDCESLESFAEAFIEAQSDDSSQDASVRDRTYTIEYKEGDEGYISCSPLKAFYDGRGEIDDEELLKGLTTGELARFLYDGDCIEGAVLEDESEPPLFSIKKAYLDFALPPAKDDKRTHRLHESLVLSIFHGPTPDKDRLRLISDKGYAGLMRDSGQYKPGDIIVTYTHSINTINGDTYINLDEPSFCSEAVGKFDAEHVLDGFILSREDALARLGRPASRTENSREEIFRSLGVMLSRSRDKSSTGRLRDLLTSAFIFNALGDDESRDEVLSGARFLMECLRLAEGHKVRACSGPGLMREREQRIIEALANPDQMRVTADLDPEEKEILDLLDACALAKKYPDEISASPAVIRRRICRILGVEDHFRETEDRGGGKYGLGELADVEFKSSYVFSNRDSKPDIYQQGRGQVWEAVCGFLNRDGGTVYLGVNDHGDPILNESYGLGADLSWFRSNYTTLANERLKQLGHPVPQPKDLDSYCRFLNDEMELYFKPAIRRCITVTPTKDQDAIMIIAKPSEFEIAKLYTGNDWKDGTVYIRNGEETVPMSIHAQEQRLMELRSVGKVEKFIIALEEAIDKQRKVMLKGYASSNSNEIRDRLVVPVNLVCDNENLWAYDLQDKALKEFRLARIGSIETNIDDPEYPHAFPKGEADVFRWINPKVNLHIRLEMTIAALNSLREEYHDACKLPPEELYQTEAGTWILDTRLHGLGAARRFCIGLADQVKILDSENADALRDDIRKFVTMHLGGQAMRGSGGDER